MRHSASPFRATWLVWLLAACDGSDPASDPVDASDPPPSDAAGSSDGEPGPDAPVGEPAEGLCGWAATPGDGLSTTTGGGDAEPVTVTSADQLIELAADPEPRVLQIDGILAIPQLEVASNKTIIGVGSGSGIDGGIQIKGESVTERVSNVILRNLRLNAATTDLEDGIQIQFAHHVWVDHLEVFDAPDGNLDVTHGADHVTISWTVFHYTAATPDPDHRFSNLIGHTDGNEEEDEGRLRVTFHHNWWGDGVRERMPRVRWGHIHVLNNYYSAAGNNYCIAAGLNARIIVEGNAFSGVSDPNILFDEEDPTAGLTAFGNQYENTTGPENGDLGAEVPPLPDSYAPCQTDPAENVPALVMAGSGPR